MFDIYIIKYIYIFCNIAKMITTKSIVNIRQSTWLQKYKEYFTHLHCYPCSGIMLISVYFQFYYVFLPK